MLLVLVDTRILYLGFPPVADLAQLVLSWKPRQSASTMSVYCQTSISGNIKSCMPPDSSQPLQQSHQQKKKKQGQTISECLKLREAKAVTSSSDAAACHSADSVVMHHIETNQASVDCTSQAVSTSQVHSEICVLSSADPAVQLSDNSSASITSAQGSQSPPMPVTAAAACHSHNNSTSPCGLTPDFAGFGNSQHSTAISEVGGQRSSVNTSTASRCYTETVCSSGKTVDPGSAAVSSSQSLLLLPSSTRLCPAVIPTTAVPTYRVTERVTSGTVLVDMDIGSNVLGSGLMYGTFVYHGGRLIMGQQRQNNSAVSVWPLLPDVNPCQAPVYFVAGSRPVVAPSTNMYAVTVPSEALLNGLRVVCDGVSNVVDDSQLTMTVNDIQSNASAAGVSVESHVTASVGTKTSHSGAESGSEVLEESGQPNVELTNTDTDNAVAGDPVMSSSAADGEHCSEKVNSNKSCSPVVAFVTSAISTVDSHSDITTAEPCMLAGVNSESVTRSASVKSVPPANRPELPQITNIRTVPATSDNTVTNDQFVASHGSVASHYSTAVLSCADVFTSSTSPFVSSALLSGNCSVGTEATSGDASDIPLTAVSKQQRGKRKPVSQLAEECSSKAKIGRMDLQKRISKYICPPPDSASDKDSEIIHVMDRFGDKSLEQYLCSVHRHVSYCNASTQHLAPDLFQNTSEDHVGMVNIPPSITAHVCDSSGKHSAGLNASIVSSSAVQPNNLNHEHMQTATQFSATLSKKNPCSNQSQSSHIHVDDISSRADIIPTSHSKGFALANFLSTTATPNLLISSLSQQPSLLDSTQTSKNDQMEKIVNSSLMEPVHAQNHNFMPVKLSSSAMTCDSASNMLPDDLSLTDNDFAMILSDTDDSSMFSVPSRKSLDNNYWSLGFGSVCGRLRDRAKDVPGIESLHASADDLYHSVVPMFREQNCMPEADYIINEHIDLGSKVGFSVSSLTCKTNSVCRTTPSSLQIANSFSNNSTLMSVGIPLSYSLVSQQNEALHGHTNSHNDLQDASTTQASKVLCSAAESSARGIFSLAHHAIQPASKSFIPNSSSSNEVAQSASVLWSPCNGNARKSSLSSDSMFSEHRQSLNVGHQCRLPSSAISDVHWRMPESSNFVPLYNSWTDNLYCSVQPLARPRPFVDQTVSVQPGACNVQSKTPFPKLQSVSETHHEKFNGKWSDDDFCHFVGSKNKTASSKHVPLNCQYSSHEKLPDASNSQPFWTYSECGIAPQSYLSTSRGWLPANNPDTSAAMTFDLSLSVPATSCLSASTCRLPSFSFATVPPVPDFLSLSFATTAGSMDTATKTGSEVRTWPVSTVMTASTNAPHGWSPMFPQHTALQSQHIVSTSSSSIPSTITVSSTRTQDIHPDVTYTVPSFIHTDKESQKQSSSFNTHLPSYTLWHGTEHVPVEMCNLPAVSMINTDGQLLPIHGRVLYPSNEAGFINNTLTSPPLHHHPMYSNQQAGIYVTGEKQVTFETPFSLPRLPLTSQVLNFSTSFETIPPAARAISSETYHDPAFNVGHVPVRIRSTEDDTRRSHNISQPHRPTNLKRPSKYPKQLKHNATSLCVGYPAIQNSTICQSVAGDVPTYLPAGPFVGSTLQHKSHSSDYQVGVAFGPMFGSCSLRHGLAGEFTKSLGVTTTTDPQTAASQPNQRHNFDIGAFISELSSNSSQAVTVPAAIRRLDFPTPPVHVLQQPAGASERYQLQMECNQTNSSVSDHASHNFGLHNMSINSLLGDNPYPGFAHRYEVYSDNANQSTSTLPPFDVPTLNFSIRSQMPAVNFERPHNTKARHT